MVVQDRTIASLVFVLCALAATVLVIFHLHISHVSLEHMQVFDVFMQEVSDTHTTHMLGLDLVA